MYAQENVFCPNIMMINFAASAAQTSDPALHQMPHTIYTYIATVTVYPMAVLRHYT